MNKSTTYNFIKSQLLIFINVLFISILFQYIYNIYDTLSVPLNSLNNLTVEDALAIETLIKTDLNSPLIGEELNRSFVFFYLNNYTTRKVFTSKLDALPSNISPNIPEDPFYTLMLQYHENDICLVTATSNINKSSGIYKTLSENGEIAPDTFYFSCPIYIDNILIGYVAGLNFNSVGQVSVGTSSVKNTAKQIGKLIQNIKN